MLVYGIGHSPKFTEFLLGMLHVDKCPFAESEWLFKEPVCHLSQYLKQTEFLLPVTKKPSGPDTDNGKLFWVSRASKKFLLGFSKSLFLLLLNSVSH